MYRLSGGNLGLRVLQTIPDWWVFNEIPSGELTVCYGKIHHFSWENPLFLWQFSIAMLVYQRVYTINVWLVVWNMNFMTFHISGIIIPTDELHHFSGG